jgi:glucose/arabinose transport system substrate-binding protein
MKSTQVVGIIAALVVVAVVAYLLGTMSQGPPTLTTTTPPTSPTATTPSVKKITFYTWWAGLERFAIDAVIGNFTKKTGIQVEKTAVPGGAGVNAKFAILALMQAGSPPAAFQVHCGPEMLSYIYVAPKGEASFVELSQVAKEIDMSAQAADVLSACSLNGKVYALPVNIHRANLIFINKQVLDKLGGSVPVSLDELVALCGKASAAGVPCLLQAGADQFTILHLWEQVFLAAAGPQKFIMFMYGTLPPDDPSLRQSTEIFLTLAKTFPANWPALDWTGAVADLVAGKGLAHVDGDWVVGLIYNVYPQVKMCPYTAVTPDCNIIVAPFPGTGGVYNLVIDSVAVPAGGPTTQLGMEFVKYFAGPEGQSIFNPLKGSIAVYKNIDPAIYPTSIQRWEVEEYRNAKAYVFSLTHGALFSDVWQMLMQQSIVLVQTGRADLWYDTLSKALATERSLWKDTWYMGAPGKPFGGYQPPWVK